MDFAVPADHKMKQKKTKRQILGPCQRTKNEEYEEADTIKQADTRQIHDETDCISHSTNTLEKGMNPVILPSAMGK